MRKRSFADAIDAHFKLGNQLKQRDVQGVRKTVSGLLKLLFPDGSHTKQDVEDVLNYALKARRRVKEQLKKLGGMEFYDVHFSYTDTETMEEHFATLPGQRSDKLIGNDPLPAGHVYGVSRGNRDMIGLYRVELQAVDGNGKLVRTGGRIKRKYVTRSAWRLTTLRRTAAELVVRSTPTLEIISSH